MRFVPLREAQMRFSGIALSAYSVAIGIEDTGIGLRSPARGHFAIDLAKQCLDRFF
jgi:hypothetical protein